MGGDVIADALEEGTPLVGLIDIPGVIVAIGVFVGVVFVVRVRVDPVVDVSTEEGVSTGTRVADEAAQPVSNNTEIANVNNNFNGLNPVSSSPRY